MLQVALTLLFALPLGAETFAVFRGNAQGANWVPVSTGLPSVSRINAFAPSGASYVAATDRGIYVSRNEANSWQVSQPEVRALSLVAQGSNVFAGTDKEGLLRSLDSGLHWQLIAASRFRYVRSLAAKGNTIFAGTDAQGVFSSSDNGTTWRSISTGLPAQSQVFSMAFHQGALYAGLYRKGLYRLDPQLELWAKVGDVLPLALASTGEALLAGHNPGGIFQKNEANPSWSPAKLSFVPKLGQAPVWELSASQGVALAGVSSYVYRSIDQGRTWEPIETGIPVGATGIAFLTSARLTLVAVSLPSR